MEEIETITRVNKYLVIKFIEDTINDFNTYDWYFNEELTKDIYHRVNCVSFMYDYIDYNYIIGNIESDFMNNYKHKLALFSKAPLDAFRGFRTGGLKPLNFMTGDTVFRVV